MPFESDLIVVNEGAKGGVNTLFVHGYIGEPIQETFIVTIKVTYIPSMWKLKRREAR